MICRASAQARLLPKLARVARFDVTDVSSGPKVSLTNWEQVQIVFLPRARFPRNSRSYLHKLLKTRHKLRSAPMAAELRLALRQVAPASFGSQAKQSFWD